MEKANRTAWSPKRRSLSAIAVSVKGGSLGTAVSEPLLAIAYYIVTVFLLHVLPHVVCTWKPAYISNSSWMCYYDSTQIRLFPRNIPYRLCFLHYQCVTWWKWMIVLVPVSLFWILFIIFVVALMTTSVGSDSTLAKKFPAYRTMLNLRKQKW